MGFYSLVYALYVPTTSFLFSFLIYQKIILSLTQHNINKQTNIKIPKNPLMQAIYIFARNDTLVIAFFLWKKSIGATLRSSIMKISRSRFQHHRGWWCLSAREAYMHHKKTWAPSTRWHMHCMYQYFFFFLFF
jgi:hypothetical protein